MSAISRSEQIPSLQALALQAYIENRPCNESFKPEPAEVEDKFPEPWVAGLIFSQWELLKKNAPTGPLALRKMMRDTESALQCILASSQTQTSHAEQSSFSLYRLACGVELPKDSRASLLFRNLNETMQKSIRESNEWKCFDITLESQAILSKTLDRKRIYVAPEELAKLQDILTKALAPAKLERLWKQFRSSEVPRLTKAQVIQTWLRDPVHADQIRNIRSLRNQYLETPVLPPEIGLFSGIHSLVVCPSPGDGYHTVAPIPESLGNLTNLRIFQAHAQNLEHLPDSFGKLTNLDRLLLGNNELEQIPESFGNLIHLKVLQLGKNHLTHLPRSLGNLRSLTHLDLDSNKLQSLPPSFAELSHLRSLNISHNCFEQLPESLFRQLKDLNKLNLSHNQFVRLPSSLALLTNLYNLIVDHNPLLLLSPINQTLMENYRLVCYQEHLLSSHNPQTDASRLFQAIARKDIPAIEALVHALTPSKKHEIFSRYRTLKAQCGSSSNASSSSPIPIQITLFAQSLLGIAHETFYGLTDAQKMRVVSLVRGLENRPPESSPYFTHDQNILRFVDALEIVKKETDSLKRKKDDPSNSFPKGGPDSKRPKTSESGSSSSPQS